jgi:Rrf2 family protein
MMQLKGIAAAEHIPIKFLSKSCWLSKTPVCCTAKWDWGGYYLAKPAQDITLGKIVRILDGSLAPIGCVSQMAYEPCNCPDEATCQLRAVMGNVRNAISDILDHTSLADVANSQASHPLRQELHQDLGD